MRQTLRSTAAALLLAGTVALGASACTGSDDTSTDAPDGEGTAVTPAWPTAIDPATAQDAFWVVWTDVADTAEGAAKLQPTIDALAAAGYTTLPWDPACQSGAEEQLGGLTGYADPLGVGVAFASAEEAGMFDTLYEGATVSVTEGTYTCTPAS
ncbi:hypothetical protein [Cellulomonas fimi]|uniref:Lipoprotein n=1 Tax=Cellulomonas fimi (strain ATCC 484 / DSM 20113 / JCM 1341 / CCUG 24087 / LMG 16345 / NBRC 15513 / NCIMB 8980 / NCTC 7547 / NRS-133) TaxID=590998 RepID=F4H1D6_CELFA|nr:hypothetical protein [Cellulomonas fimi]AEE45107.1 hypothetical protein Celf_0970 [Cellulomonas fimi ATCC 484]NNH06330.1 hypothetical protein [Cellulomonas fimi]VEH28260.1 Uncharacterised protein [Cellulomonas fimi]